ncbi:hypothetical protein [Streptomyces sp. NPDC005828]|uniref:hypothetical protein n=1 Tax=Streptomyces sp. NPDC005828 TaxID=3157071 RepID=UPI0033EAE0B1
MKVRTLASGTTEMQLVCEDWRPEYEEHFRSGGCDGLFVTCPRPGASTDLSFAPLVPGLRSLRLGLGVRDLGPVADCHGLTVLQIGGGASPGRIDLSGLPALRVLEAPVEAVLAGVAGLPALDSLTLTGWRRGSLERLGAHPRLGFLRIECTRGGGLTLTGAAGMPELRALWLHDGDLSDTAALAACERVEEIRLVGAKTPTVSFAARLPHLRRLTLENCGPLDSLRPLSAHPSLREIALAGTTTVEDGDLRPLADNPRLTHIALENGAPHYSHPVSEVRRSPTRIPEES